jgi:glycosyltransferase involved in cell wall biosynthesis
MNRESNVSGGGETEDYEVELSVVMPCLDEGETVGRCIDKAAGFMREHDISGEVIVADNGSSDGSREIAASHGACVVEVEAKGYGSASKGGIKAARGRYIIMGDADDSYDFTALMPFVEKLREGYDLVVGNRFAGGIKRGAMPPLHRYFGNPVLSGLGRLFFKTPARDFHCGLRGFRREAVERMRLQTTGMEFASEMVMKASLYDMKVTEVPTILWPAGRGRPAHLRSWRDGWRHLRFMLLYSPRWLFLYPGLFLMLVGTLIGAALLPGPILIGRTGFSLHTLVYAGAMISIGFNAVLFAVLTRIYAVQAGMLPREPKYVRFFRYVNLEMGLAVGAFIFLLGLVGLVISIMMWNQVGFGRMNEPETTMRVVVPSVVAMSLGSQIILSSFFISILGIEREAFVVRLF